MGEILKTMYISATMVATVIGAGFATGQEIYTFFVRYGKWSFLGVVFVLFLFWFLFYYVLKICFLRKIDDAAQLLALLPNRRLRSLGKLSIVLFSFCGFCAMASATGELVVQSVGSLRFAGVLSMLLLCGFILARGVTVIAKVNLVLAPVICIGLIYFSLHGISNRSVAVFVGGHYYADIAAVLASSIVYASYNLLSALSVLSSMRRYCTSINAAKCAGFIGALVLSCTAGMIWLVLKIYAGKIELGALPMLSIASRSGRGYGAAYSVLLLASILTTAIGCGHACVVFLRAHFGLSAGVASTVLIAAAVPVSLFGFSQIVRVLYTFFGYVGIPFLTILIFEQVKNERKFKKKSKKLENEVKRLLQ